MRPFCLIINNSNSYVNLLLAIIDVARNQLTFRECTNKYDDQSSFLLSTETFWSVVFYAKWKKMYSSRIVSIFVLSCSELNLARNKWKFTRSDDEMIASLGIKRSECSIQTWSGFWLRTSGCFDSLERICSRYDEMREIYFPVLRENVCSTERRIYSSHEWKITQTRATRLSTIRVLLQEI